MAHLQLTIDDLALDGDNPRIPHAESQRQALQKILDDQQGKLAVLSESIAEKGLNPMDRFLVIRVSRNRPEFVVLEGNRRVAALRILVNPAVLSSLNVTLSLRKRLESIAAGFDRTKIEPIDCFEVESRAEGNYWLQLRHTGENDGQGIVGWSSLAQSRFTRKDPALQAMEFVKERGGLEPEESDSIGENFPITTLQRLLSSPDVRKRIGLEVRDGRLYTNLPGHEIIKPLRRMVLDLGSKRVRVGQLMTKAQQVKYVDSFDEASRPDLSKLADERPIEAIESVEIERRVRTTRSRRAQDPSDRSVLIPKVCKMSVTDNRIAEIYNELRRIPLDRCPNACAVLFRVFLELSIDHYMKQHHIDLDIRTKGGHSVGKSLRDKVTDTVNHLIASGANKKDFTALIRGISNPRSPLSVDLLHAYVHNSYATPSKHDLISAWNNSQALFEGVWR